jgi:glycosyltransferase involved in cell wall biosynthesis
MEILGKVREDVVLLIGGKGELRGKLQELIDGMSLDNTHLLGFIEDDLLPQYYQASDLFVLPSETMEGYGLITLEAFACGLPVLGTGTGAIPEIIEAVLPNFVASGLEPEALAESILGCLSLLSGVDKASLRSFAKERSWARVADRVENVFQDISL